MFSRTACIPVLLAACALAACGSKEVSAPQPRPVRSVVVAAGEGGAATTYTAEIRSRYETDLSFQVGGKIVARTVEVGDTVKRGEVLARLAPTDQRLGVDAARSALSAARAELDRARSEEARYRELLERGLTTRASYLAQQTAVRTNQSRVEQAAADLRLNEQRLGYSTLRADEDGVVTRLMAEVGGVVAAGQPVVSIARPSELEAVFDAPDGRIDEIRRARGVQLALLANQEVRYPARIREISPSADPVTRTYLVRTSIPNPPNGLRLGMSVAIVLTHGGGGPIISLPPTALFQKEREPAVWIVKDDRTLELRAVSIDRYESDRVLVASGLTPGDRVVTAGVHRLAAGDRVRLMEGAPR